MLISFIFSYSEHFFVLFCATFIFHSGDKAANDIGIATNCSAIVGPVTNNVSNSRQGWRFGLIPTLNALNYPTSSCTLGILGPSYTPGGEIGDFLHNFE